MTFIVQVTKRTSTSLNIVIFSAGSTNLAEINTGQRQEQKYAYKIYSSKENFLKIWRCDMFRWKMSNGNFFHVDMKDENLSP